MEKWLKNKYIDYFIIGFTTIVILFAILFDQLPLLSDLLTPTIPAFLIFLILRNNTNKKFVYKLAVFCALYIILLFTPFGTIAKSILVPNSGIVLFYLSLIYIWYFSIKIRTLGLLVAALWIIVSILLIFQLELIAETVAILAFCEVFFIIIYSLRLLRKENMHDN